MDWLRITPMLSKIGEVFRVTFAEKPFSLVTVTVVNAEDPALTLRLAGKTESLKSAT